jgi:transglutaminase-like putative cysteine protease
LFLCLPTAFIIGLLGYLSSDKISVLHHRQVIYFAAGIFLSCIFHSFRFRFLPAFLVLLLLCTLFNLFVDNFAFGEFDSFFLVIEFILFRFLFIAGWLCGWGFSRSKYFPAVFSVALLALGVIITALLGKTGVSELSGSFAPTMIYAFYIIFMNELLRNTDEDKLRSWYVPLKGLLLYLTAMTLLLLITFNIFNRQIKIIEAKWDKPATVEADNGYRLYDVMSDSTVKIKESMSVSDRMSRSEGDDNSALFVVYIDNFFPSSEIPNPLYLVSEYLPTFADDTETFESDSLMPDNDLFSPDPSKIPLYFTAADTSKIRKTAAFQYRKVVETEVYKIRLHETEFAAPATAFYCQPLAVKPDLRSRYKSAYRAKSLVSELNSAYFVYNNIDRDLDMQMFQQQRFDLLDRIKNFDGLDTVFLNYYTQFPQNAAYDTIKTIARTIVEKAKAKTPVDKILAIRDYFMQTDELGIPMYRYSDVATTVPAGSRIINFLLNDHVGNCTYYAGSAFLLFRACGIPARIATGYAVVDRSSNNKGWYWIYNKQAHAWIQVFFPEYGWLDFDLTFGDSEQQEAPATDGTPPLDPQKAWFAASGEVTGVDTVEQSLRFAISEMVCFDKEYKLPEACIVDLDLSLALILKDSLQIKIGKIKKGDAGLAISFTQTDEVKKDRLTSGTAASIIKNLPDPLPVDQFHLQDTKKQSKKTASTEQNDQNRDGLSPLAAVLIVIILFAVLAFIVVFSVPCLIFRIYSRKAKRITDPATQAYYPYRASMFLMHQLGYLRHELTPLQYATQIIDVELGTSFGAFVATYLKVKYAQQELTNEDSQRIMTFYRSFEQAIKSKIKFKKRFCRFLNIYNTLEFFTKPRD